MIKKKVLNDCTMCGHQEIDNFILCDTCGQELGSTERPYYKSPTVIKLRILDADYDFCNYSCLLKFIIMELRKQNPETRFEFGEEIK